MLIFCLLPMILRFDLLHRKSFARQSLIISQATWFILYQYPFRHIFVLFLLYIQILLLQYIHYLAFSHHIIISTIKFLHLKLSVHNYGSCHCRCLCNLSYIQRIWRQISKEKKLSLWTFSNSLPKTSLEVKSPTPSTTCYMVTEGNRLGLKIQNQRWLIWKHKNQE